MDPREGKKSLYRFYLEWHGPDNYVIGQWTLFLNGSNYFVFSLLFQNTKQISVTHSRPASAGKPRIPGNAEVVFDVEVVGLPGKEPELIDLIGDE